MLGSKPRAPLIERLPAFVSSGAPALVAPVGERTAHRYFEFFTAQIRSPNTRSAYARGAK